MPKLSLLAAPLLALLLAACASSGAPDFDVPMLARAEAHAQSDPRYAGIVVDAGTGTILYAEDADRVRHPASLTKMMTLYLLFEDLKAGRLKLSTPLAVSAHAASQPPTKLGVKAGESISVRTAISAICVHSANDVAVVVAEALGGSEAGFAARMNAKARALGLVATHFENATGLPDARQVTTARDMAVLARALQRDFPDRYANFSAKSFAYKGRTLKATNQLLGAIPGVDGIKTGYIRASGYNLVASAKRNGRRVIVVVMGETSGSARDGHVAALIDEYLPAPGALAGR
jgi:D-alanyl-D-alanine carboxypeptidase